MRSNDTTHTTQKETREALHSANAQPRGESSHSSTSGCVHGSSAENEAKWHPKAHLSRRKRVVAKKLVHVNIIWKPVTFVTHTQCMRTPSPRDLSRRGALWSEASYTGLGSLNGAASELGRFRNLQTFWGGGVRVLHRGTPSRGSHCSSTALHTCPLTRRTHTPA